MEHARRSCGGSLLGPGFESPRLHFEKFNRVEGSPEMGSLFSFSEREIRQVELLVNHENEAVGFRRHVPVLARVTRN